MIQTIWVSVCFDGRRMFLPLSRTLQSHLTGREGSSQTTHSLLQSTWEKGKYPLVKLTVKFSLIPQTQEHQYNMAHMV